MLSRLFRWFWWDSNGDAVVQSVSPVTGTWEYPVVTGTWEYAASAAAVADSGSNVGADGLVAMPGWLMPGGGTVTTQEVVAGVTGTWEYPTAATGTWEP